MPRVPARVLRARVAAAIALAASGCSTIGTVFLPHRLAQEMPCIPRVYSGVCADVAILRSDAVDKELAVWDLPFSLVADTLLLPYTIYAQIRHGNLCPPATPWTAAGEPVGQESAPPDGQARSLRHGDGE
jgi:uncharacterized protein YceK